jgi:hypothetical protein
MKNPHITAFKLYLSSFLIVYIGLIINNSHILISLLPALIITLPSLILLILLAKKNGKATKTKEKLEWKSVIKYSFLISLILVLIQLPFWWMAESSPGTMENIGSALLAIGLTLITLLLAPFVAYVIYNVRNNNKKWSALYCGTLTQILTLVLLVLIGFLMLS